jgi:hypothetical protein
MRLRAGVLMTALVPAYPPRKPPCGSTCAHTRAHYPPITAVGVDVDAVRRIYELGTP